MGYDGCVEEYECEYNYDPNIVCSEVLVTSSDAASKFAAMFANLAYSATDLQLHAQQQTRSMALGSL